jgi:hypothetical protein
MPLSRVSASREREIDLTGHISPIGTSFPVSSRRDEAAALHDQLKLTGIGARRDDFCCATFQSWRFRSEASTYEYDESRQLAE